MMDDALSRIDAMLRGLGIDPDEDDEDEQGGGSHDDFVAGFTGHDPPRLGGSPSWSATTTWRPLSLDDDDDDWADDFVEAPAAQDERRSPSASVAHPASAARAPSDADWRDDPEFDLPDLHEPPGYRRDRRGVWRYVTGGDPVPAARDITLSRLWNFDRRPGPVVLVPVDLTYRSPELAWCRTRGALTTHRTVGVTVSCFEIPRRLWQERARVPIGIDAPELALDRLLDPQGVADFLRIGRATVASYLNRGFLPPPVRRVGSTPLWSVPVVIRHRVRTDR